MHLTNLKDLDKKMISPVHVFEGKQSRSCDSLLSPHVADELFVFVIGVTCNTGVYGHMEKGSSQ